jgi:hypothetical protein
MLVSYNGATSAVSLKQYSGYHIFKTEIIPVTVFLAMSSKPSRQVLLRYLLGIKDILVEFLDLLGSGTVDLVSFSQAL